MQLQQEQSGWWQLLCIFIASLLMKCLNAFTVPQYEEMLKKVHERPYSIFKKAPTLGKTKNRRLGHAKTEETWNTYSHLYPREEERAINTLDKIV